MQEEEAVYLKVKIDKERLSGYALTLIYTHSIFVFTLPQAQDVAY